MQLMITEVTDMSPGNFCVAGWDLERKVMVRPLPNGNNWTTAWLHQHDLKPGIIMDFVPTGQPHNGSYPHTTEDTVVNLGQITVKDRPVPDWLGPNSPTRASTVQEAFDCNVKNASTWNGNLKGVYVNYGTQCRSLWGLEIPRQNITFISDSFNNGSAKLRAIVCDGQGKYDLSVSSHALKEGFFQGGIDAVEATIPKAGLLHIRLGLARAFQDMPERCTLMVNGVYG